MSHDPQELLQEMVDALRPASHGLFSAGQPQFVHRDKGLYAYLVAKPSKRLASTLAVDREVLVLFTSFPEQQQRTIKTARELIHESLGRLESTVAIIVHPDAEGNLKLKKWGRGLGLSVLPIYSPSCPPRPDDLERLLGHELFSHDPFDVTGPVSDDENFFGRRNEAQDLARKMQTGQIRSCLGIRKIGKTSIINRIIGDSKMHHDCYCAVLDCSKDEIWSLDASKLMCALAETVARALTNPDRYAAVQSPVQSASLADASRLLSSTLAESEKPVLLFVDEVDYITPGSPTAPHWRAEFNPFWRNFRAVYQEVCRDRHPISVLVSGVSSKWFSVDAIDGVENAALALIPEEYLSPLPRGATTAMIKKIARSAGLTFPEDCAELVASISSDMPYWARKACSYVHRNIDISSRPYTVNLSQTRDLIDEFIKREGETIALVAIRHLFRVYPELESTCLQTMIGVDSSGKASDRAGQLPQYYMNILQKYGVLITRRDDPNAAAMIKAGMKLYVEEKGARPSATVQGTQEDGPERDASSLSQWADDLAVLNRERNLLEKKLRQIVLNFLRVDSLSNKQKGTAKTRILQVISSERRGRFDNLDGDAVMEKLCWSELASVMKREWGLFQGVFSDRNQFELQFGVVNERFDAHAKDLDTADFALYRRALKWINDRITAI